MTTSIKEPVNQRFSSLPFILIGKIAVLIAATNSPLAAQHYWNWALEQGVGHQTADSDFDEDGISNILEYAVGSSPLQSGEPSVLNSNFVAVYPKSQAAKTAGNVIWKIQTSQTMALDSWITTVPDRESDSELAINLRTQANIAGSDKIFARLAVSRTAHPIALSYAATTGLTGAPLNEVSQVLYELEDAGVTPDFLFLPGSRYRSRKGSLVHAVIGGTGNVTGTITDSERAMAFNGSASWIEFNNPAKNEALTDYTLFAVASAVSVNQESLIASSDGGDSQRGCRLMFNASSSWGAGPGLLYADVNKGDSGSTSGWFTTTRIHSPRQLLPVSFTYSSRTALPRGDLALPTPGPRVTVSAGITRYTGGGFAGLGNTLWNGSPKFRIGANLTGGSYHQGKIAMVLVTRSSALEESVFQRIATAPIRAGLVSRYGPEVFAVFDGDSVTEGAGSPGANYGTWSFVAQLFGGVGGQFPGGQWSGKFNGRNIAVGGRAIASSEAAWEHTTRHLLSRVEWGKRYYFGMVSHNQSDMGNEVNLARVETLWNKAKRLGAYPVCIGLLSGQNGGVGYDQTYAAVKARALNNGVAFIDTGAISQLKAGAFPSGPSHFYLDVIHPTEKGYRLITQEIAATLIMPGSLAPRSIAKPEISGLPKVGAILTCGRGLWENAPTSITFQWMRNATDIPNANTGSYSMVLADLGAKISCRVIAFNTSGAAERTSSHTATVVQF